MDDLLPYISFEQAKAIAEAVALTYVQRLDYDRSWPLLEDRCLEGEHCWMFFTNRRIYFAPGSLGSPAYAISKRGTGRIIANFYDDPVRAEEYLQTMSNYFYERGDREEIKDRRLRSS